MWPTDQRASQPTHKGRKTKASKPVDYPHLKVGSIGAITLERTKDGFNWKPISNHAPDRRLVSNGSVVSVFPPTKPALLRIPHTTSKQRAEQGANFLRSHFPDIDITAELIRSEVEKDERFTRNSEAYDPFMGNLLSTVTCHGGKFNQAFLVFPMGSVNCDLNVSLIHDSRDKKAELDPSNEAIRHFQTPLRQIVTSDDHSTSGLPSHISTDSYIAARTMGSCTIMHAQVDNDKMNLEDTAVITHAETGNRAIMDVKLRSHSTSATLVNNMGSIFKCDLSVEKNVITAHSGASDSEEMFWKLALTENNDGCLLASSCDAKQFDFRVDGSVADIYKSTKPCELVTFVETPRDDHLVRLVSTQELMWIDVRFPRKPLLGYRHDRHYDRTLECHTVRFPDTRTFLTSRKNGLVTVYDVSRAGCQLLEVHDSPCVLPPSTSQDTSSSHGGITFFRSTSDRAQRGVSLFQLGSRGQVCRRNFTTPGSSMSFPDTRWSEKVEALGVRADDALAEIGPLGRRDLIMEVDLNPAYRAIYNIDGDPQVLQGVQDTLDRMPTFWQESDIPVEHILTTYDIAFRSGEDPVSTCRADFLTGSALSSARGFQALSHGTFSTDPLSRGATWHHNILPTLQKSIPELSDDPNAFAQHLRRQHDLAPRENRPAHSYQREKEAAEQLALDLALSQDVFSPEPFSRRSGLEDAAKAMSLGEEPPPIHFGYLKPIEMERMDEEDGEGSATTTPLETPLGVRLLLREWDLEASTKDYVYTDPYDDVDVSRAPPPLRKPKAAQPSTSAAPPVLVQQFKPPPIIRAQWQQQPAAPPLARPRPSFGSQGIEAPPESSQDAMMTSTQVLPGPHGGRQQVGVKKKPAKKRMGGF